MFGWRWEVLGLSAVVIFLAQTLDRTPSNSL